MTLLHRVGYSPEQGGDITEPSRRSSRRRLPHSRLVARIVLDVRVGGLAFADLACSHLWALRQEADAVGFAKSRPTDHQALV